ncbi:MAG: signal peptidase I [Candidatus Hydrogenedentes bacterium]|nr:signal peptidase I [Candidatus Hydrogenedentota bacterium]
MAKKNKKPSKSTNVARSTRDSSAGKIGPWALVVGALVAVVGGLTRENGLEWIKSIFIAVALALAIRWSLAEPFKIPSDSMKPTFEGDERFMRGDRVFVNKWIYGLRFPFNGSRLPFTQTRVWYAQHRIWRGALPQRGDIAVFRAVGEKPRHDILVKRVVGLPGERIHIAGGKVYVNGAPLDAPKSIANNFYTSDGEFGVLQDDAHAVVPENCYLLLGDNSRASSDGRFFGWVPEVHILGRVACIWWPISRWRDFTGFTKTWWWRSTIALLSVLLVVRLLFGRSWRVRFETLGNTLRPDEHVFVNRFIYGLPLPFTRVRILPGRRPCRGEIVLYHSPGGEGHLSLGRVAGLPKEQVYLDEGRLTVDGAAVTDPPSLAQGVFTSGDGVGPFGRSKGKEFSLVPEDHYFILCDTVQDGEDSRSLGWIPHRNLVGPVRAVWWPPRRWRRVRIG